jgi:hypothetical protein
VQSLQQVLDENSSFKDRAPLGHAEEGPGGTLVVVGPEGVLDGVDALVKKATAGPPLPPPRNVEVEFWVVRGVPAAKAATAKSLDPVGSALEAVQQTDGPMDLSLLAKRRLLTIDGERGEVTDNAVSIRQTIGIEPGTTTIVVDTVVGVPSRGLEQSEVRTRLSLQSGAVAVLSQAGGPSADGPSSIYVLVRPTILD